MTHCRFALTNKVAVITGGAGLLGRHFSRALADAGATVCIVDQNKCDELVAEISLATGRQAFSFEGDVSDPKSVNEVVRQIVSTCGRIDVLHSNAASKSSNIDSFFAPFEQFSFDTWREVMSVNIDGMFLVAQAVGKQMIAQGSGGSVIQTASIYGIVAPDQRIYEGSEYNGRAINTPAVYSASKAAVVGLTHYLATYWAAHGIRVNTLTPGGIESGQNDEFRRRYSNRVPLGRMGAADELTGALVFLASDESSYITGHNLIVDGGLSVW